MQRPAEQRPVDELAEKILAKRPRLKDILEQTGTRTLTEHAQGFSRSFKTISNSRQDELLAAVNRQVQKIWGSTFPGLSAYLKKNYYALTGDHHGPLAHPFFLTADLLPALTAAEYIVVLATNAVSLNNASRPRGILHHSPAGQLQQINLLPAKLSATPVAAARGYQVSDIEKLQLPALLEELLRDPEILAQERFGRQISLLNEKIWKKIFDHRSAAPQLLYLELEEVAADLLLRHHLDRDTPIGHLIAETGTKYFWQLRRRGESVKRERVDIPAARVSQLLQTQQLIPDNTLCLLVVSAYYGLKCLGGFSQTTYLYEAQTSYNSRFDLPPDPSPHTQTINADLIAAYLAAGPSLLPATALDIILYGDAQSWYNFQATCESITLKEAFYASLPALYRELYPAAAKPTLTAEEIMNLLGARSRIRPVAQL